MNSIAPGIKTIITKRTEFIPFGVENNLSKIPRAFEQKIPTCLQASQIFISFGEFIFWVVKGICLITKGGLANDIKCCFADCEYSGKFVTGAQKRTNPYAIRTWATPSHFRGCPPILSLCQEFRLTCYHNVG